MSLKIKVAGRALELLHVEDNPGDAVLIKQAVRKAGFPIHLATVEDGEEALLFLRREGSYFQSPRPDVVLLDLKLPRKDGLSVLTEIRQSPDLSNMPVLIFTNSESDLDMSWAKRCNATQYIVKPMEPEHYGDLMKNLRDYWIKTFRSRV